MKNQFKIDDDFKSKIYNLPLGFEMVCDGGWWFPAVKSKFKTLSIGMFSRVLKRLW